MKRQVLIVFFIPSRTVRNELFPDMLRKFGTPSDKICVGIGREGPFYPPFSDRPDILVISDRDPDLSALSPFLKIAPDYDYLYVALHKDSEFKEQQKSLIEKQLKNSAVVFKDFHRSEHDKLYECLKKTAVLTTKVVDSDKYQAGLKELVKNFDADWKLEEELQQLHRQLVTRFKGQEIVPGGNKALLVWNDDQFAEILKKAFGQDRICTSLNDLEKKLKKHKNVVLLAELNWQRHKLTQFWGYDLAKDLIEKGAEFNLAFISFLPRNQLQARTATANLLATVFPHYQLLLSPEEWGDLAVPLISKTKWHFIRSYILEKGGIIDYIEHKIKHLRKNSPLPKFRDALQQIEIFRSLFPGHILELVETIQSAITENPEKFMEYKSELEELLKSFKEESASADSEEVEKWQYRIMVVEDDSETLNVLRKGLEKHFAVETYSSGEEALEALRKDSYRYSALLVDLELLDEEGNWQPLQGYDLIEQAGKVSHLVIYILSALSKRAISTIHSSLVLNEVPYFIPKDPQTGLPIDYLTYRNFADQLRWQIERKRRFLKGPKNGVFARGLLRYYYEVKSSENYDWGKIWRDIVDRVERFLIVEGNNPKIVPGTLYGQNPKRFDLRILKTALMHRLIVLHHQAVHGKVYFSDIKDEIGFRQEQGRRYFNQLLGFSIIKSEGDEKYYINIDIGDLLFEEEEKWLKSKTYFRNLLETLNSILEEDEYDLRATAENRRCKLPGRLSSLADCLQFLKFCNRFYGRNSTAKMETRRRLWIAEDIETYWKNNHEEIELLKENQQTGRKIVELLQKIKQFVR